MKIIASSNFTDNCEDSNSILTVELNKFGLTSDSTFLEKLLLGGLCQEDVNTFQQFLDVNNKYDLANTLSRFMDYLMSNKDDIDSIVLRIPDAKNTESSSCGNILEYIHPLEVVVFTRIQEKFATLKGTDETELVFGKHANSTAFFQLPEISKTELTLFSSWTSYLTLLVNSRCELSLARTLNVPDRELEPSVFKALKKTAKEKEMPMFQTALSHITQVRLGGKGYRPSSKSLLGQHVKGLGDYVDFVDRLRSHLEDYSLSPKVAIKRVLLSLQREFLASKKSTEFRPYADSVYKQFFALLRDTCAASQVAPSPKTPNSGGTLAGREAFRVLHKLITKLNLIHSIRSVSSLNFASNLSKLNHTPVLEAFKSPSEVKSLQNFTAIHDENAVVFPNDNDEKRIKDITKTPDNKILKKSRKSQEINWAKTPETPFFRVSKIYQDEFSNGVLDLEEKENSEDIDEDENELEKTITMVEDVSSNSVTTRKEKDSTEFAKKISTSENKMKDSQADLKKRKVFKDVETMKNQPASKKSMTQKVKPTPKVPVVKSKAKETKLKQGPIKGQKSLTAFFKGWTVHCICSLWSVNCKF